MFEENQGGKPNYAVMKHFPPYFNNSGTHPHILHIHKNLVHINLFLWHKQATPSHYLNQSNILFQKYKKNYLNPNWTPLIINLCYKYSLLLLLLFCLMQKVIKVFSLYFLCYTSLWDGSYQQSTLVRLILRERIPHSSWNISIFLSINFP